MIRFIRNKNATRDAVIFAAVLVFFSAGALPAQANGFVSELLEKRIESIEKKIAEAWRRRESQTARDLTRQLDKELDAIVERPAADAWATADAATRRAITAQA